jgi:hypothetical protein
MCRLYINWTLLFLFGVAEVASPGAFLLVAPTTLAIVVAVTKELFVWHKRIRSVALLQVRIFSANPDV